MLLTLEVVSQAPDRRLHPSEGRLRERMLASSTLGRCVTILRSAHNLNLHALDKDERLAERQIIDPRSCKRIASKADD